MSRTFRNRFNGLGWNPLGCKYIAQHRTYLGLIACGAYISQPEFEFLDPRCAVNNGYDGKQTSGVYSSYHGPGYKEEYQNKTKRYFKRRYHRQRRVEDKKLVNEDY